MANGNDPRLRQDKFERKDRENTNAGMIAGIIIVLIGIVGIFLFYNYEVAPTQTTTVTETTAPATAPATTETTTPAPATTTTEPATPAPATPAEPAPAPQQ